MDRGFFGRMWAGNGRGFLDFALLHRGYPAGHRYRHLHRTREPFSLGSELGSPIVAVEILNPYNDKEMLDEKLSIVDIKARDEAQRMYQIEIQLLNYSNIPARMAYTWADIYSKQLKEGEKLDCTPRKWSKS
jgi:hypothetical protein